MEQITLDNCFDGVEPVGVYGIQYLDDKLVSINKGELVLIGATSGCGKSQLAYIIARTNSERGVKTALFSLENSQGDVLRKEIYNKYRKLCENWKMSFRDFNLIVKKQMYDGELLEKAKQQAMESIKDIWLYEKPTEGFTVEDMKREFDRAAKDGCKLLIVDHLDYFDQINGNEKDECKYLREIMKAIRKMIEVYQVPVIAFSQFRKPTDQKMIIPTQYEFYGSSDKAKIATTIITMARNYDETCGENESHTYIAIRKDRFGLQSVADCVYDLKTNSYRAYYRLGYTNEWGHYFKDVV